MVNKAETKLPDWVMKLIEPGTEVHVIGGRYYLYKYTYEYNKETKRHKKQSIFLGRLVENVGLVSKGSNVAVPRKPRTRKHPVLPDVSDNMEYGISFWMNKTIAPIYYNLVQRHFGISWQTIIAISFCRFVFQSSIRDMQSHFNNSFLSIMLPDARTDDEYVTELLRSIGINSGRQVDFFNEFSALGDIVTFYSQKQSLCDVNVVNGFSMLKQQPSYIGCLAGDINETEAIKACINEFPRKEKVIALFDYELFSEKNIKNLQDSGLTYIIPINRNAIDCESGRNMTLFTFESRTIQSKELTKLFDSNVYLYLDDALEYKEKHDALVQLNAELEKKSKSERELWTEYRKKEKKFGTMILITNGNQGPEKTYIAYKSCEQAKKNISLTQNIPDEDIHLIKDENVYKGWMFCNFIALHWYFLLRNVLVENETIDKISPKNILTELWNYQIVKINGEWSTIERTKKHQEDILDILKLDIKYPFE